MSGSTLRRGRPCLRLDGALRSFRKPVVKRRGASAKEGREKWHDQNIIRYEVGEGAQRGEKPVVARRGVKTSYGMKLRKCFLTWRIAPALCRQVCDLRESG